MSAVLEAKLRSAPTDGACWHDSTLAVTANINKQCEALRCDARGHREFSRRLGLPRPALFLNLFPGCSGHCSALQSLGNVFAYYVLARAAALAGGLDFLFTARDCPEARHALHLLPKVVPAAAVEPNASSYAAAAAVACHGYPNMLAHKSTSWHAVVPAVRTELRAGLAAWAEKQRFPPAAAPYDEVAVHFRCGDVLKRQHPEYGILPLAALAALIPADRPTTVGIVTMRFGSACTKCEAWLRAGRGRRPHQCPGSMWVTLCACPCAAVVNELVTGLAQLRPRARVTVRDADAPLGAWARLVFARVATVCMPSTFCLWPALAAVGHGYFVASPVWPNASAVAAHLPRFSVLADPPFVTYDSLPRGVRASGKRKRRPTFAGNCTTSPAAARAWVRRRVWPDSIRAQSR